MDKGDTMMNLYSGTPGSGKSLHVADRILWALRMKKHVIANFDVNCDVVGKKKYNEYFHFLSNKMLNPKYLIEFSINHFKGKLVKEDSIILVIDESQLLFNARTWDSFGRDGWIEFFTQHRKYGYSIYLIAQFDRMLDRQLRSLIEYEYIHRKLSNYGWRGILLQIIMLSPRLFVSVKVWYPMKEKVGSEMFRYKKKMGKMYNTYLDFKK